VTLHDGLTALRSPPAAYLAVGGPFGKKLCNFLQKKPNFCPRAMRMLHSGIAGRSIVHMQHEAHVTANDARTAQERK